ncbi:MAG: AAA family ATPase [Chitinophagales bacterium]|nr:AAA family ATPase [Chitinophagales bacterium]
MITKIEIDGFKSLSDFSLKLNQGVNILVGPNGAGKTNIILFFEFLSQLIKNPIGRAVSSVGGAGAIFKKIGPNNYQDNIKFKIFGSTKQKSKLYYVYEYEAEVKTSFEKDSIYFTHQRIKIRTASRFHNDPDKYQTRLNWDVDIEYTKEELSSEKYKIFKLNQKKFKPRFILTENDEKGDFKKSFEKFALEQNPSSKPIIYTLFPYLDISHRIMSDLVGGESFNIIPSKVKEFEDAATPAEIKRDGSGLGTTLYAMKNSKAKDQNERRIFFGFDKPERSFEPKSLEKIKSYLKLANNTVSDITIDNDPFDNKLLIKITIKTGDYEAVLPLSAMSDGTIKWLSLITAILTSRTIFSIEEPENFLHPWMQSEIAQIMRDHISEKDTESFVLMTTHSESLLNSSQPEEIIIVDLREGKTIAKRIGNLQLIKDEISNSGFGLGHFYFSNSIQHA